MIAINLDDNNLKKNVTIPLRRYEPIGDKDSVPGEWVKFSDNFRVYTEATPSDVFVRFSPRIQTLCP